MPIVEPSQTLRDPKVEPGTVEWWQAPVRFMVHAVVGTFIFTLIACTAFGLHALVHVLEKEQLEAALVWGLKIAEYALFLADIILFLVFLWRNFRRTIGEL